MEPNRFWNSLKHVELMYFMCNYKRKTRGLWQRFIIKTFSGIKTAITKISPSYLYIGKSSTCTCCKTAFYIDTGSSILEIGRSHICTKTCRASVLVVHTFESTLKIDLIWLIYSWVVCGMYAFAKKIINWHVIQIVLASNLLIYSK